MALGLEERLNAVDSPASLAWETPDQPRHALALGTKAIDQFDQLGADRTLLILGEPGSGKTITLLELARDLINRANQDINLPIPIVFNLSSWKGGKQTIDNWLVQELNRQYQVPKQTGSKWVNDGQLLLLLDGLDEVKEDIRSACVHALNQFRQEHGRAEMIVTSRIKDYEALKHRLRFSGAIYVQPLTEAQIQHHLANAGTKLATVSTALQTDTQLQELAKSPLMLNIITLAYQGITVETLPTMNIEERRQHLFNAYIERMFSRRGADCRYPKHKAMHWLIWLAARMVQKSQTVFFIEGMQPSWLVGETHKQQYRIGVRLMVGLLSGLYVGLLSGILNYEPSNSQLVFGLLPQLISGLASGLVAGLLSGLESGVIVGLISALIFGLISLLIVPQTPQPVNVVIFGIIFGIIFQRLNNQEIEPVDAVRWSWLEAKKKWIIGMIGGLISGIVLLISGLFIVICKLDNISNDWLENFLKFAILPGFYQKSIPNIDLQSLYGNISNIGLGLLSLGLFVGALIGLILGFKKEPEVERKTFPNQGIWRSTLNSAKLFAISGTIGGIISALAWWIYHQHPEVIWWIYYGNHPRDGLIFVLTIGLMVGLLSSLVGGDNSGLVSIQHFILRVILWKSDSTPWNYARFLDYATTRIFLQKVGGGYIFIHRLLLEHFALMSQPNNGSDDE
jgi:DNA polymerase III delta prime subunit